MAQVTVSSVIDAPVDEVWKRIGAFDSPADWLPFVVSSPMVEGASRDTVGSVREVTQEDGGVFREALVALSHADHFYEYTFVSSPIPVRSHRTTLRLLPITDGDRSYFEWVCRFEIDPELEAQLVEEIRRNFTAGAVALRESFTR
jgi:Polyketide cyclase / dehydrase and lipid transport